MRRPISEEHPLRLLFEESVSKALADEPEPREPVRDYLTGLLLRFLHTDGVFRIRDDRGKPVKTVIEMLAEGDVRLKANSFDREREVHKHVGDYILFWTGVHPDFLSLVDLKGGRLICDYTEQGRRSYRIVSSFDHPPYESEADMFLRLSARFDSYSGALRRVSESLPIQLGDSAA